jgi:hypothetical protein
MGAARVKHWPRDEFEPIPAPPKLIRHGWLIVALVGFAAYAATLAICYGRA